MAPGRVACVRQILIQKSLGIQVAVIYATILALLTLLFFLACRWYLAVIRSPLEYPGLASLVFGHAAAWTVLLCFVYKKLPGSPSAGFRVDVDGRVAIVECPLALPVSSLLHVYDLDGPSFLKLWNDGPCLYFRRGLGRVSAQRLVDELRWRDDCSGSMQARKAWVDTLVMKMNAEDDLVRVAWTQAEVYYLQQEDMRRAP